jgi:hypothetical protein
MGAQLKRAESRALSALRAGLTTDGSWLLLACALLACVPIWVCAIDAIFSGWIPLGDKAFTAVRAWDVLSLHPPLAGQWSSGATAAVGAPTYSPGPMLFWLLAIPVRLPWQSSLPFVMAVVNTAAVAGVLVLARRRGGLGLMLVTAISFALMLGSLPGETYADIWNSSAALMPLVLLVFLAWSLACGEHRLLPLTVVVASFVTQAHLTFVAPALGLTAVGVVGLVLHGRRRLLEPGPRRWLLASLLLVAVCWSAPALDQVVHRPGNLVLIERSARANVPRLGLDSGWHALAHAVGVVPAWLASPGRANRIAAARSASVGTGAAVSTALILAGLAAALAVGLRRRRYDLAAAAAVGLLICASIVSVAASTPADQWFTLSYTLRWASPAGMCVWILGAWALTRMLPVRVPPLGRPAMAAGVAAVACVSLLVALGYAPRRQTYDQLRQAAERIEARVPASDTILVHGDLRLGTAFALADVEGGIAAELHRDGRKVVFPAAEAVGFGNSYVGPYDSVVWLRADRRPTDGVVVAAIRTPDLLTGKMRRVYAWIPPPG